MPGPLPLSTTEVESFLARHPQLRHVDVLLADLNGVERGKRIGVMTPTELASSLVAVRQQ